MIDKGCGVSFGDDPNVPKWIIAMVAQLSEDMENPLSCVRSMGSCLLCESHLSISITKIKRPSTSESPGILISNAVLGLLSLDLWGRSRNLNLNKNT